MENKPINEFGARKICFEQACRILCVFLRNRNATAYRQSALLELFELQENIYQHGKEKGIW